MSEADTAWTDGATSEYLKLKKENADLKAKLAEAEKDAERMRVAATEMWNDWKGGDFDLPKLAQLDLRSIMNAAGKGPLLDMMDAVKEGE